MLLSITIQIVLNIENDDYILLRKELLDNKTYRYVQLFFFISIVSSAIAIPYSSGRCIVGLRPAINPQIPIPGESNARPSLLRIVSSPMGLSIGGINMYYIEK